LSGNFLFRFDYNSFQPLLLPAFFERRGMKEDTTDSLKPQFPINFYTELEIWK